MGVLKLIGFFIGSMDLPECMQILFDWNVKKSLKVIHEMQKISPNSQLKGELQLNNLNYSVDFIIKGND